MNRVYTQEEVGNIARELLMQMEPHAERATVLGLIGDLGAGKTTLTQQIAILLGVSETVVSPTFVIAKFYQTTHTYFTSLIHIDAYRIESLDELGPLGWEQMLVLPNTLVVIEWPERILQALPADSTLYKISHNDTSRTIQIYEKK